MTLADRFASALADLTGPAPPGALGVAVSGGGDSVALMALAADWAAARGVALQAVTVDHGLRPSAAAEARAVAAQAAALGLPHAVLIWRWDRRGNLQDAARRARLRLIGAWARERGLAAVLLGHTRDDVAETLLLRLARGAGVDGLAAMAARREAEGMVWLRPLIGLGRAALRDELRARGLSWAEDPSNEDPRFDRALARAALAALAALGIDAEGLAATAHRLAEARTALEATTAEAAQRIARVGLAGEVAVEAAGLAALPREIARRLVAGTLRWVASADYPPRHEALIDLLARLAAGQDATLHGCHVLVAGGTLTFCREAAAVAGLAAPAPGPWDGRWRIDGPPVPGAEIRVLGEEGLALCPDWRALGSPRAAVLATPAVWQGRRLLAAPAAGRPAGWAARLAQGPGGFPAAFGAH